MKKIALVTGGNSGIGYATAKLLKEKNYEVFISGRNSDRLKQAADELGVKSVLADMSKPEDIHKLAAGFLESGLDVLVNNAGITKPIFISEFTLNDFSEIFNVNVRGPLLLIRDLLPALEKRQGSISTVSAAIVTKSMGMSGFSLYAASKGAVDCFTRNLVTELAPKGIRINAVSPGFTDTPIFTKTNLAPEEVAGFKETLKPGIPLARLGEPEEVAQVIVAQLESTYVTGAVWVVDGGVSVV